jgi:hypothetical protein
MRTFSVSHLPVLPHSLFPSEVQPLLLFRGRLLSRLLDKILPFAFFDVALQDAADSNRSRLMQLVSQFQKPVVVSHHVRRLDRILQDLGHCRPHIARRLVHTLCGLYQVQLDRTNIDHGSVINAKALPPEFRPLVLLQVVTLEIRRRHHEQDMVVRVCGAVALRSRNLDGTHPAARGKGTKLGQSDPRLAHTIQGSPELMNVTVTDGQRHEEKARIGVIPQQPRQCSVDFRLPHERPSPLTYRTVPYSTEPCGLEFELVLFCSQWVMREAENLRTVLYPRGVALMPIDLTAGVDLSDIIGLSSMHIPRFVTWRGIGQILIRVASMLWYWYYTQVTRLPRRHKNPASLPNSQLVVYGVFYCLSIAKSLFLLAFHINVIPLKTERKVGLGRKFIS